MWLTVQSTYGFAGSRFSCTSLWRRARQRMPYLRPIRQAARHVSSVRTRCNASLSPACGSQTTEYLLSGPGVSAPRGSKNDPLTPEAKCSALKLLSGTRRYIVRTSARSGVCLLPSYLLQRIPQMSIKPDSTPSSSQEAWYRPQWWVPGQSVTRHMVSTGKVWIMVRTGFAAMSFHSPSSSHKSRKICARKTTVGKTVSSGACGSCFWKTAWSPSWTDLASTKMASWVPLYMAGTLMVCVGNAFVMASGKGPITKTARASVEMKRPSLRNCCTSWKVAKAIPCASFWTSVNCNCGNASPALLINAPGGMESELGSNWIGVFCCFAFWVRDLRISRSAPNFVWALSWMRRCSSVCVTHINGFGLLFPSCLRADQGFFASSAWLILAVPKILIAAVARLWTSVASTPFPGRICSSAATMLCSDAPNPTGLYGATSPATTARLGWHFSKMRACDSDKSPRRYPKCARATVPQESWHVCGKIQEERMLIWVKFQADLSDCTMGSRCARDVPLRPS